LKTITDAVASYHHFTATAIRYFGVSGGLVVKGKSSQELFRQHTLIVTTLLTVSRSLWMNCFQKASSIRKDLAQVAFDLIDRFHVRSVKTQHQRQT